MANSLIFLLGCALFLSLASCGNQGPDPTPETAQTTADLLSPAPVPEKTELPLPVNKNPDGIAGYYVGYFNAMEYGPLRRPSYSNKINIAIDSVVRQTLYGHSVVAGNLRPFSGEFKKAGDLYCGPRSRAATSTTVLFPSQ